ncbi:MAG: DUF1080 domain-containing protein [Verrucomicrobiota bacterium JB023]|nr:DUF1080 domain-containing protein [Verrucomicrobiota bacterium JB023]
MKRITGILVALAGFCSGEWVGLSGGEDLTGWLGGAGETEVAGYKLVDGHIQSTPESRNLVSEKEYEDYILEFEFKLTPGANNGLGIHYPGKGDAAYVGMEVQILDNSSEKYQGKLKDYQWHGSIYTMVPALRGHLKPVGEWNKERVTVRGPWVTVELNGVTITRANLDELNEKFPKHEGAKRRKGHIAFCGHGDVVHWKNIRIAELPHGETATEGWYQAPGKADAELADLGFKSLCDLKDWRMEKGHEGHWTSKDGWIIAYDGKSEAEDKNLWSFDDFKNFELVADWRWVGGGKEMPRPVLLPNGLEMRDGKGEIVKEVVNELDSGIYLRGTPRTQVNLWNWPVGSGEVYGVRVNSKDLLVKAGVTPRVKADKPDGEWNRFVIRMVDDKLTAYLNGEPVLWEAVLPDAPEKGRLALQHHGAPLEFGNLFIRSL